MTTRHTMRRLFGLTSIILIGAVACSSDEEPADRGGDGADIAADIDADNAVDEVAGDDSGSGEAPTLDGEYAFGLGRESMTQVFESTFSSNNAKAHWDGNTMIIEMDGDAESSRASINCSAISTFLIEGDTAEFHYPNGVFACD